MTFRQAAPQFGRDIAAADAQVRVRLPEATEWLRKRLDAPGATSAVALRDGSVICAAVGLSDLEAEVPMPATARMPGGSTGKTVAAATSLSLHLDRRLSLDAPIGNWLAAETWFDRLPNAQRLTLRMLLMHTGGVPDHMGLATTFELLKRMRNSNVDAFLRPVEAVQLILDEPPVVEPGSGFFYSDTSYILAGLVVEAATGRRFYDEARDRVLSPLGLVDFAPAVSRRIERLVPGYTDAAPDSGLPHKMTGPDGALVYSPAHEWTGGGYVTSSRDLARLIWSYASGRAFGASYLADVKRTVGYSWSPGQVGGYGLGVFASHSSLGETWGHGGYFSGYRSQMTYIPSLDIAVAYQVNSSSHFGSYQQIVAARRAAARKPLPSTELAGDDDLSIRFARMALGLA